MEGGVERIASGLWPTLWLLAVLLWTWGLWRLAGARATLPLRTFGLLFALGAIAVAAAAVYLERLAEARIGFRAATALGPALEELLKAAPALALVLVLDRHRRLSLADAALAGAATGLGFQFVETNLRLLAVGEPGADPAGVQVLLPGFAALLPGSPAAAYFPGHSFGPALCGLAAAAGAHLWNRGAGLLLGLAALAWVTFDHATYNLLVAQQWPAGHYPSEATFRAPALPTGLPGLLYRADLHGLLAPLAAVAGLLGLGWHEARRLQAAAPAPASWLVPGEGPAPSALTELGLVAARLLGNPTRPAGAARLAAYFRHRRGAQLAALAATREPAAGEAQRHAETARATLALERARLEAMHENPAPARLALPRPLTLAAAALFLVFFMLGRRFLPGPAVGALYSPAAAALLAAAAAAYLALRLAPLLRNRPRARTPDARAELAARLALAATALLVLVAVAAGALLPARGGLAFILDAYSEWTYRSGRPEVLFALGALLAAHLAPSPGAAAPEEP